MIHETYYSVGQNEQRRRVCWDAQGEGKARMYVVWAQSNIMTDILKNKKEWRTDFCGQFEELEVARNCYMGLVMKAAYEFWGVEDDVVNTSRSYAQSNLGARA